MSNHTPGPWNILPHAEGDETIDAIAGDHAYEGTHVRARWVAELDASNLDGEPGENEANARLVAAAPDLLAACEAVLAAMDGGTWVTGGMHQAYVMRAAVARAKEGGAA